MPYDENNIEAARPAPPPPTIKTGTVMSLKVFSLDQRWSSAFLLPDNQMQERGPVTDGDHDCQCPQHKWQQYLLQGFFYSYMGRSRAQHEQHQARTRQYRQSGKPDADQQAKPPENF